MSQPHLACAPGKIADSLREAKELCERRGGNLTPLRKQVLTLLLESRLPSKAYDILRQLKDDGAAKPPTVYRALDFLLKTGLAHRIESLNAFVPCGHWAHSHWAVFLICDRCGSAEELDAGDSIRKLGHEVEGVKFRMKSAVIEVRGVCRACA